MSPARKPWTDTNTQPLLGGSRGSRGPFLTALFLEDRHKNLIAANGCRAATFANVKKRGNFLDTLSKKTLWEPTFVSLEPLPFLLTLLHPRTQITLPRLWKLFENLRLFFGFLCFSWFPKIYLYFITLSNSNHLPFLDTLPQELISDFSDRLM